MTSKVGLNLNIENLFAIAKNSISQNLSRISKKNAVITITSLSSLYVAWKIWRGIQIRLKLPRFPGNYYFYFGNYKYTTRGEDGAEFKLLQSQRDFKSDAITISLPDFNTYTIVITDASLARECFVRNGAHTSARIFSLIETFGYYMEKYFSPKYSIAGSTGKIWHDNRRKALGGLRELGVGKNRLEQLVNTESDYLHESLVSNVGFSNKQTVSRLFATATTNVICQLCFGIRFSYNDPEFKLLYKSIRTFLDGNFLTSLKLFLPEMIRRAPFIYNDEVEDFFASAVHMRSFIKNQVELQQSLLKEGSETDFEMNQEDCLLKTFVKHFKHHPNPKETQILISVMLDMFLAGTDTTSTTLEWAIYYLRNHPDIQELLKNEIANNISNEQIVFSDMEKLPMCHAFLLETMRFGAIAPSTAPHVVTKEFSAGKYTFPKGSIIEISIFCMNRDPKIFKNPDKFDINNFLQNGKVETPENFFVFGIGPRVCLGEKIARIEAFVFLANIIKKFTFSNADMKHPTNDDNSIIGLIRSPKDFQVHISQD